ncbi:MAG: prolyl oligopeptidase family serine peptidase [Polyangiaceae bacterium]
MKTTLRNLVLFGLSVTLLACSRQRPTAPRSFYFPPANPTPTEQAPVVPVPVPTTAKPGYSGLGVESISPEILAEHAPRALKPEESRRIQAMLDVRAPSAGRVSPDGKRLFFNWSITGTPQVFRLDGAMSFPTQLTGGEDPTSVVGMTPDGKWLFVSRDRSGEENPGLYMLSPDGGPLVAIQHKPKVQTFLQHVADDGGSIYYRANDVTPESYAIYRFDLATSKATLVFGEAGIWSIADVFSKNGVDEKLLLAKSVGSNMNEYFEYDLASKKLTPLFGQGEREDYVATYGAGGEILVLTPKLGEYRRLYKFAAGALEPVSPEIAHDVASFDVDDQKRRILYTVNEGGYTRLFALDAKSKKPLSIKKLPQGDHAFFGATSHDGRFTTIAIDPGTSPVESYVYDWDTSSLKRWHRPAAPEIDTSSFARVSLESYPARDGTQIPMFVRRPAGCTTRSAADGPCAVIVSFHGGPEGQSLAGFSTRAQLFVDAGFVYAEPNVRGSEGYGKTWLHADDGAKRLGVITDIEDASKYVRAQWAVGGKAPKVGIYGGSYGGYSVLVGMSLFAGAYDVGVSVVGISSLLTFLENTAPYRRVLRISEYGDPDKDRDALTALSPITHVDKVKAPLMLLQGATDPRVPVGEALQFYDALKAKGVPTELIVFPDEGHGFQKRSNQVLALGHTLRFFKENLK